MLVFFLGPLLFPVAQPKAYRVDTRQTGPVFDGIGAISGGGATSKLFFSVNATIRQDILKILFKPPGGVRLLKIELGGDDQSTDGSEASHWPEENATDFRRGYEWRLVKEAIAVSPRLKVCVLPWAFPHWVGNPMDNPEKATKYVVEWIKEAYSQLKVRTYCVGLWNERAWTEEYVIHLRRTLDRAGLPFRVKIVVGDNYKTPEDDFRRMLAPNFTRYVDIIGVHYPGGKLPAFVRESGKTLWSSEDYSTMEQGFGCMARIINWNYVRGNMTGTLVWHLVSGFYDSFPYFGAGLMSPSPPDYLSYAPTPAYMAFWSTAAFTRPGWRLLKHGHGSGHLSKGGTYVGYTDGKHLTIVVETMSPEMSECYYSNPKNYSVADEQKVSFSLASDLDLSTLHRVEDGQSKPLKIKNKRINLGLVPKDTLIVLTTLRPPSPPTAPASPDRANCVGDYYDDYSGVSLLFFQYLALDYENGDEARWLSPQKGSWLVYNGTLVQTVTLKPVSWCSGDTNTPVAVMPGASVTVDALRPSDSSPFPFVGIRTNCTGCEVGTCLGLFLTVDTNSSFLFTNFSSWEPIASFELGEPFLPDQWTRLSLKLTSPENVLVTVGSTVKSFSNLSFPANGTVVLGSNGYGRSLWDNLFVEDVFR